MKQNAQLMPMISVDSVDQARAFYVDKLGFGHMMGMLFAQHCLRSSCKRVLVRREPGLALWFQLGSYEGPKNAVTGNWMASALLPSRSVTFRKRYAGLDTRLLWVDCCRS
jgi:hypothetical protein